VGLFSKENAAVLPGILLLYDLTWSGRSTWRRRAPAYAVVALPFAAFFYLRNGVHAHMLVEFTENPLVSAGFWTARLTAVKVVGLFLWRFLWPARLSADYSYDAVPLFGWRLWSWEDAKALVALAVCLGAALVAVLLAIRRRGAEKPLLFFLVFFFVAMAPTSNLIILIGSIMAERFLYLPSIGLAGCVVAAVHGLGRWPLAKRRGVASVAAQGAGQDAVPKGTVQIAARAAGAEHIAAQDAARAVSPDSDRVAAPGTGPQGAGQDAALAVLPGAERVAWAALALVCVALTARTYARNIDWQDDRSLWASAVDACPGAARPHYNLGLELERLPDGLPDAIAEYRAALRIEPAFAEAHNNLANALSQMPDGLPAAIAEYRAALRIQPDRAAMHFNLANALVRMPDRLADAIVEYQAALRIQPGDADAHDNLANALARVPGRLADAIAEYQAALRIQPDRAEVHYNLANALAQTPGRLPDAIAEYRAVLRSEPDLVEAHVNLGNTLARTGRLPEAIGEYETALRIRPDPQLQQIVDRLRAGMPRAARFR
jgi:tetratricopeptide (TPR) repeat protein